MRPKGLTEFDIQKIIEFDWNNSDDDENQGEDGQADDLESLLESSIQKSNEREDEIEVGLLEQIVEEDDTENTVSKSPATAQKVLEKTNLSTLRWRNIELEMTDVTWKNNIKGAEVKHPIEYFSSFFDDEIVQKICDETNLYALQTSAIKLPDTRMAWAKNIRLRAISDSLTRSRFEKLKAFFHINNNADQAEKGHPNFDKLYKIRPLLKKIREKCNQIEQEEYQSVDEQIISYKGHLSAKQYLPNKPYEWGFKVFTRVGVSGLIYDFALYIGEGTCPSYGLGISSDIVLHLSENLPENQNFKIFFDNWFTSISLVIALREKGILAVGTIPNNRLGKCSLSHEKELAKKGRGSFDVKYEATYNLTACRWYDKKSVQLISNYVGVNPVSECDRWCRKAKMFVSISRPHIVECYNKHMGGVDLSDMLLELYKINDRSKKWYMRIVYWCINMAVVNGWLLYRRELKIQNPTAKHITLLNFQLDIANELLGASKASQTALTRKRCRPTSLPQSPLATPLISSPTSFRDSSPTLSSPTLSSPTLSDCSPSSSKRSFTFEPTTSVRYDQTGHWIQWGSKGKCRLCKTGFPKSKCSKCNIFLCSNTQKNCFVSYHT